MLLPTKRIPHDRAIISIGAFVLRLLKSPKTVSRLWDDLRATTNPRTEVQRVTYNWFVLALDFLYAIGAIELRDGRVTRVHQ